MKSVGSMLVLALVLALVAVPVLAQAPDSMPEEVWATVSGRDGFSIYDEDAVAANLSGTSVAKPASMPLQLWIDINSRDGFGIYSAETLHARTAAANSGYGDMPASLRSIINGRAGFNVYDTGEQLAASLSESATRPSSMPEDLWQIIHGREGFVTYSQCAVC